MARTVRQSITAFAYDKRGRLLSVGKNSYVKTHPLQAEYAKRVGNEYRIYLHAEMDAIIKARGQPIHRMVVLRVNAKGEYVNAKPCASCALALQEYGVKHVEHS